MRTNTSSTAATPLAENRTVRHLSCCAAALLLLAGSLVGCGDSSDNPAADSAVASADSSTPGSDSASNADDSGAAADSATPASDSAPPPTADSSTPGSDSAPPTLDSGTAGSDSGPPPTSDAGTTITVCQKTFGQAQACGASPVGSWRYSKACTDTDPWTALRTICASATGKAKAIGSAGTLVMSANKTFTRSLTTTIQGTVTFPASCAAVQLGGCAVLGAAIATASPGSSASCSQAAAGCSCTVTTVLSTIDAGTWSQAGSIVTARPAGGAARDYFVCARGKSLTYRGTANNNADNTVTYLLSR